MTLIATAVIDHLIKVGVADGCLDWRSGMLLVAAAVPGLLGDVVDSIAFSLPTKLLGCSILPF